MQWMAADGAGVKLDDWGLFLIAPAVEVTHERCERLILDQLLVELAHVLAFVLAIIPIGATAIGGFARLVVDGQMVVLIYVALRCNRSGHFRFLYS
jgi:hypothetical protein